MNSGENGSGRCSTLESPLAQHRRGQSSPVVLTTGSGNQGPFLKQMQSTLSMVSFLSIYYALISKHDPHLTQAHAAYHLI